MNINSNYNNNTIIFQLFSEKYLKLVLIIFLFFCCQSYVACGWGISAVGYVTMGYGVISAIMDLSSGFLVKWFTRIPVFVLAATSHFIMFLVLLVSKPEVNNFNLFFVLSGVYGIGASVWWSQITGNLFLNII